MTSENSQILRASILYPKPKRSWYRLYDGSILVIFRPCINEQISTISDGLQRQKIRKLKPSLRTTLLTYSTWFDSRLGSYHGGGLMQL